MKREKNFSGLFKSNDKKELKFNNFTQLTPIGKRIVYIIVNQVKKTIQWLREKRFICYSKSDQRTVQNIIHYWKISGGEVFQKYSKSTRTNEEIKPFTCNTCKTVFKQNSDLDQHTSLCNSLLLSNSLDQNLHEISKYVCSCF